MALLTRKFALASIALASTLALTISPSMARAAGSTSMGAVAQDGFDPQVHYLPCEVYGSIPGNGTPPLGQPSPAIVAALNAEPARPCPVGFKAFYISGGTRAQQEALANQLTEQMWQAHLAAVPADAAVSSASSCPQTDYYVPWDQYPGSADVRVVAHYQVNSDCTHNFYYTDQSFNGGPTGSTWWQQEQIRAQDGHAYTGTAASNDSNGDTIPKNVSFVGTCCSSAPDSNGPYTNGTETSWVDNEYYCTSRDVVGCKASALYHQYFSTN